MRGQSTPKVAPRFRRALLAWFRRAARDLPSRRTRDPYAVLVSEVMLQQTQVSRILDNYQPFLDRYPTIHHLARARPTAVREAWDGLGYDRDIADLAAALQPRKGTTAWTSNQALMELGALVCTARAPRCARCPVRNTCRWFKESRR